MICRVCFQTYDGLYCPFCAVHRQVVGQAASPSDSSGITLTSSSVSPASTGTVTAASWEDLQLLYPFMWPGYIAGKLIDPSQERDMQTKRNQLGAVSLQLNNVVKSCTALPATDVQNWNLFSQSLIPWLDKSPSVYNASTDNDQATLYQDQLRGWQIEISKYCNIGMPMLPKATPTFAQLGGEFIEDVGKAFDTVKFLLVLGAGMLLISVAIIGVDNTRKIVTKALL